MSNPTNVVPNESIPASPAVKTKHPGGRPKGSKNKPKMIPGVVPEPPTLNRKLGVFLTSPFASPPEFKTEQSACFDLKACVTSDMAFDSTSVGTNKKLTLLPSKETAMTPYSIAIPPHTRVPIPIGLIFDIPQGYYVRLYSRSGLALSRGLVLANGVGIIDSDYVEPVFALIENNSDLTQRIYHGDRICQGEVVRQGIHVRFDFLQHRPAQKTSRSGGLGSTGVS